MRGYSDSVAAVILSFAENVEKHSAIALPAGQLTELELQRLVDDLDVRLKSKCLGLIEI